MAIIIKTEEEIMHLREGGRRLATILNAVSKKAVPGVCVLDLDKYAEELIRAGGDEPAFLGYRPAFHMDPYPATLCVSINSEVVHGIPKKNIFLKEGDIVSLDLGLKHNNLFTDHAVTVIAGKGSKKDQEFLENTHEALLVGIFEAVAGNKTGDIGFAISEFVKPFKYGVVRDLAGHGVGRAIHEDPFIPNYGKKGTGALLEPGMVVAIEPMLTQGRQETTVDADGYTVRTSDGSRAAHFEHTILIRDGEAEILTII